jgi:hypothetical protein
LQEDLAFFLAVRNHDAAQADIGDDYAVGKVFDFEGHGAFDGAAFDAKPCGGALAWVNFDGLGIGVDGGEFDGCFGFSADGKFCDFAQVFLNFVSFDGC